MAHTPASQQKSSQPRDNNASDLASRMSTMSIGATPQHVSVPANEADPYAGGPGSGLRHHLPGSSHSHPYTSLGHLPNAPPPAPFGYQDFGTPYWAAQPNSGGGGGGGGSAPPSAGPMGVFNVPFTPTDASSPTGTFPYGSALDNNMTGTGYDTNVYHQHHHQTPADIYATGQGGFGVTQPPPPRRRGGGGCANQVDYSDRGWSPHNGHAGMDGGMTNLGSGAGGGGRLSDPATAPYYGVSGPGYVMSQGLYGNQGGDRRKQNRENGPRNGGRSFRQQQDYQPSNAPLSPLMSPISVSSHLSGYQAPQGLPIQYGLHPNYVPNAWRGGNNTAYTRRDHVPRSALLDEFRMNKSRKWSLADIAGHMVEFCGDQHGSRFIQQRLEQGQDEDRATVLAEIEPDTFALMMDVFGNYVIQKLFEVCNQGQKVQLAAKMEGNVFKLSLEMYGCRVVQKAFEHVLQDQKDRLVEELRGKVVECVKDNNGNHVIQRLITLSNCPDFIPRAFVGHVSELACHPFGCRVLQKTFESLDPEQTRDLLEEMHEDILKYTTDSFGNYVAQSILTSTTDNDRHRVIEAYKGNLQTMARHKFASNVIEKALKQADERERREMIDELIDEQPDGSNQIAKLLKDAYGNFPVQTALNVADADQRDKLLEYITACLPHLKHTPVGKRLEMRLAERGLSLTPPPLNPLSASTSASEAPSGPDTVLSEETGITSADIVQVRSRSGLVTVSGGGAAGQGGKGELKQSLSSPPGGIREDEALESLLH